jgi:hypothetical protein
VFYYENQPVAECVGFKGLPQGSALTSFSYSFYTTQATLVRCWILQYADDLTVYASHDVLENVQRTVQSACAGLNEFFRDSRYLSSYYSQGNTNPSVYVTLNGQCMSVVPKFRYLGVVFDGKLLWGPHVHYIQQ